MCTDFESGKTVKKTDDIKRHFFVRQIKKEPGYCS
jgi:hypothetical protein